MWAHNASALVTVECAIELAGFGVALTTGIHLQGLRTPGWHKLNDLKRPGLVDLPIQKTALIINRTMPWPNENISPEDAETWMENNNYTQVIITQNLSKGQMIHITRLKTSADMWLALQAIHETKGHLSAIAVRHALFRTDAEEGDNIVAHLAKLKAEWETLNMINADDFIITDI